MKIYNDIEVKLIRVTKDKKKLLNIAANITMKQYFNNKKNINKQLIKSLLKMNHTSLFEHINYTFLIIGASRSFLSQITRHRIASYTSGSQHYQNYENYDFLFNKNLNEKQKNIYFKTVNYCKNNYLKLLKTGLPKEEARQILPNATENNLLITINARSLINFFNLRLCNRNVLEMKIIAHKMYKLCENDFPELWQFVGADCIMSYCKQKNMKCKEQICSQK